MIRKAFVMSVNAGAELEYERRHRPIWPELEATLLEHGVRTYSIFLHADTRQLFAYVEFRDEAEWNSIARTEVCQRWWAQMRELMPSNSDNSPVSTELREVFHIAAAN
jgi:L-rhamnose mutarotase